MPVEESVGAGGAPSRPSSGDERKLGILALHGGDAAGALRHFEQALFVAPEDDHVTRLYARWARLKAAGARDDAEEAEIERSARRILRESEEPCALAYHVVGCAVLGRGDAGLALRYFRRASALDASLVDARRHAFIVERRLARAPARRAPLVTFAVAGCAVLALVTLLAR